MSTKEECIQVLVRLRPSLGSIAVCDPLIGKQLQIPSNSSNFLVTKTFNFDKVLGQLVDNRTVFHQVQPLIDEVLQGFNATILAYGQTSTGKTHTILGDTKMENARLNKNAGIIPRAIQYIYEQLENKKGDTGILDYTIRISYLELYNEDLRDLLVDGQDSLKIFEENKKIMVQNMEELVVRGLHHCLEMVQIGSDKRQTSATLCNDKSSRSHTIFIMQVLQREIVNNKEVIRLGKLNLVDLAGSESVGKSGVEKKGQREAGLINQSLLTLGRVINALVDKNSHIPYRESKLTRLLKDSLGGHTKTTLIATISGEKQSLEETLSTLDYSHRAKNIKVRPQINQRITKQELMRNYLEEIEQLKRELHAARHKNGVYLPVDQYDMFMQEHEVITNKNIVLTQQVETFEATIVKLQENSIENEKLISSLQDKVKLHQTDLKSLRHQYNSTNLQLGMYKVNQHLLNQHCFYLNNLLNKQHQEHQTTHHTLKENNQHQLNMLAIHEGNLNTISTFKQQLEQLLNSTNGSVSISSVLQDHIKSVTCELNDQIQKLMARHEQLSTTHHSTLTSDLETSIKLNTPIHIKEMDSTLIASQFKELSMNCNNFLSELAAAINNQLNSHMNSLRSVLNQQTSSVISQIESNYSNLQSEVQFYIQSVLEHNKVVNNDVNLLKTAHEQHQINNTSLIQQSQSNLISIIESALIQIKSETTNAFDKVVSQLGSNDASELQQIEDLASKSQLPILSSNMLSAVDSVQSLVNQTNIMNRNLSSSMQPISIEEVVNNCNTIQSIQYLQTQKELEKYTTQHNTGISY